jgi:predicted dehydrogenase/serine acetyltransferase
MMAAARTNPSVAVIGCGGWGRNLVRSFHKLGALAAVCDASAATCSDMVSRFEIPALSLDAILAAPEIQAIVVATPAETHAAVALRAIEAGKHVFIEKPMALDLESARRVTQAAAARGRIIMVGHLLHYHPAFLRLQELVSQGALGRLQYIDATRLNLGRFRRKEDAFWSLAPHDISMILALAGGTPQTVRASGSEHVQSHVADIVRAELAFPGGLDAHIFASWLHPYKEQKLIATGDRGMAVFDDTAAWDRKLVLYPHQITWQSGGPHPTRADGVAVPVEEAEPLLCECGHFLDCIREGRQPRTGTQDGLAVLQVLDAARQSMSSGRPVCLQAPPFFVHESAFIDEGCAIQPGTKIWHFSHVLSGSRIGRDCVIGQNVVIGPKASVGDQCKIQNNVSIYTGVTLEDGVFCGPSCVFTNVLNPRAEISRKDEFRATVVGRGATIGANATIVCGHRIGEYSFIAAGAVVTHEVPAHALMAGMPARRIGWMSRAGYRLTQDLVCPHSGERYAPDGSGGLKLLDELKEVA